MDRPLALDGVFVVADGPVPWALPAFVQVVGVAAAGDGHVDLGTGHPDLVSRAPRLGQYASHFALRRSIEQQHAGGTPLPSSIVLARPDRFAVVRPVTRAPRRTATVPATELAGLTEDDLRPAPGIVALPGVARVPTVLTAGVGADRVQDLMRLMASAIDCGVADPYEVALFLGHGAVVDVPTVGVYPTDWYLRTMADLERVVTAFLPDGPTGGSGPSVERCLARLHGLLLARFVGTVPDDLLLRHEPLVVGP